MSAALGLTSPPLHSCTLERPSDSSTTVLPPPSGPCAPGLPHVGPPLTSASSSRWTRSRLQALRSTPSNPRYANHPADFITLGYSFRSPLHSPPSRPITFVTKAKRPGAGTAGAAPSVAEMQCRQLLNNYCAGRVDRVANSMSNFADSSRAFSANCARTYLTLFQVCGNITVRVLHSDEFLDYANFTGSLIFRPGLEPL